MRDVRAMLRSALLNDLIDRYPLSGVCKPRGRAENVIRYGQQSWRAMPHQTPSGYRMVPMTMKVYEILSEMYYARGKRKVSPLMEDTFATRCIERGVSIKALQRLMGHANIATTLDIYVHVSDDFLKEAMQIFEMEDE